ncbi:hypothetical protein GCM10008910_31180 [Faecalicatena orotica]
MPGLVLTITGKSAGEMKNLCLVIELTLVRGYNKAVFRKNMEDKGEPSYENVINRAGIKGQLLSWKRNHHR